MLEAAYTKVIPERDGNPFPLGRRGVHHDPRNYLFRALVNPPKRRTEPRLLWWSGALYDQGATSRCTAESAIGLLNTTPFRPSFKSSAASYDEPVERHALYLESQKHDPWPGEAYEGSSTDAPFRVLRNRGDITAWRWAFGESEVRELVQWYCPVAVGTKWTTGMFTPDAEGYITPSGSVAGGHAYRLIGYSPARDAYRLVNSWGVGWGRRGRAWLRSSDLSSLLQDQGEAVTVDVA